MDVYSRAVLLLVLCGAGLIDLSLSCDKRILLKCMQPLKEYKQMTHGLSSVFQPEKLKNFCTVVINALNCSQSAWTSCSLAVQMVWKALDSGMVFLCKEKLDEFITNSDCWTNPEVNKTAWECQNTQKMKMLEFQSRAKTMTHRENKIEGCKLIYKYLGCIDKIKMYCSTEAVKLLHELLERMLQSTMMQLGCDHGIVIVSMNSALQLNVGQALMSLVALHFCLH